LCFILLTRGMWKYQFKQTTVIDDVEVLI
jgi:hypothetical protein